MRFNKKQLLGLILGSLTMLQANAASVLLKDGRIFEGEIKNHDSEKVVLDMNGIEITLPTNNIDSIDMSATSSVISDKKTEVKDHTTAASTNTIEAGRTVMVKISEGFNSRHNKTGQRFSGVLESNLMSGNAIVAPKGSHVYGVLTEVKKAGRVAGSASLSFTLTELSIDGTMHSLQTQTLNAEGANTGKATAGNTARAAAIGGLANGSSGAKNGAKVGAGVSLLTQGSDIEVPENTLIDFRLSAPLTIS